MQIDQNPVFRKITAPWYDSEPVCYGVIIFLSLMIIFGFIGVSVAREKTDFYPHIWIPILLILLCLTVIISIIVRMIKRTAE